VIQIVNDFFEKDMFEKIKHHCTTKLYFVPQYFENKEKINKNYYGDRFFFINDSKLLEQFINKAEEKFKIKIIDIDKSRSGVDRRNLNHFKAHVDNYHGIVANVMIMLSGPTALTNGTVFYTDENLDIHVGFKENRAIFFPSNYYHSPHASNVPNLKRFSATLFLKKYKRVL